MKCAFSLFLLLTVFAPRAFAHEVRPAYLELRQTATETYDVFWKVPGLGENMRLGIYVEFPADCSRITPPRAEMLNNAYIERWKIKRPGGLAGSTIHIAGLTATTTDVLVRIERIDGSVQVSRLTPSATSLVVEAAPRALEVARTYSVLGIEHILTGIDHLLFILALIIITYGGWKLVKTVTGFTLSHSITLTAATLGFVHVPQRPVEAVIALSIVFVACEVVHRRQGRPGLTERWPWIVALIFGLLHGLGFAGALSEVGLPAGHIPLALLFFSIGVEVGQLLFIGSVLSLLAIVTRAASVLFRSATQSNSSYDWCENLAAYAIGGVASFWLIERTLSFVS